MLNKQLVAAYDAAVTQFIRALDNLAFMRRLYERDPTKNRAIAIYEAEMEVIGARKLVKSQSVTISMALAEITESEA